MNRVTNFNKMSFKDFEDMPASNISSKVRLHQGYLDYLLEKEFMNYRLLTTSGCGPVIELADQYHVKKGNYISFVCNDYLGFTQHPKVKRAVAVSIEKYGTGAGASPLIGGYFEYHKKLEDQIASFFERPKGTAISYTTGYTSNSATLMCLLKKTDMAIVDMAVHASVYEGIKTTNTKRFLHNNLDALERILSVAQDKYKTKLVIIDGVYSQDGDLALLPDILAVTHQYDALLMVDDAHGIGVIGKTGRGTLEYFDLLQEVDIITGTFSKTFGNIGGYVIADPEIISYLQFQSRQYAFSASATPAIAGAAKAIELIDEEPQWQQQLTDNIGYYKNGLQSLGLDVGSTSSAIIPVKIGDRNKTCEAGKLLLQAGIYTNPIMYPAVALKDARIRMSLVATHTKEHLDRALNAFEYVDKKLDIAKK